MNNHSGILAGRIARLPGDTIDCLNFFSRIPVRHLKRQTEQPTEFRIAAGAWPLVGLVIALAPAGVLLLAGLAAIPPVISATLSVAFLIALTGALHEDGLADVVDGFGGGRNREDKLAIMRDSRLGTYGALALVVTLIVRVSGIATILSVNPPAAFAAIIAVAVASRSLALVHWHALLPAREDGLAANAGRPDRQALFVGLAIGIPALVLLLPFAGWQVIFAAAIASLGVVAFTRLARQQIGGHTGDTIGAAQQIAEVLLLAGLAAQWQAWM